MTFHSIDRCRSCGGSSLFRVIDLGEQPLANALREPGDPSPEARFPLEALCCEACSLVQLSGSVDPAVLFDRYHYFSSYSTTMVDAMARLAAQVRDVEGLDGGSLVVEVASNDGYLLRHYADAGVPVLGIDPARNVAEVAIERGIPTEVAYFGVSVADRLRTEGRVADVIHANNVLAHVPDVNDFVAGLARLVAPTGVIIIETPHIVPMIERTEFDTIYHEHVYYYSLTALDALFERHGLQVCDVEHLAVHGGSLRLSVRPSGHGTTMAVESLRAAEQRAGVATRDFYGDFAARVERLRSETVELLTRLADEGRTLAAYGAAAKGTVLLNHYGITHDTLAFVADRNEHKHGLLLPGVGVPIVDPSRLLADRPDHVLLLTWNFADEIIDQQRAYLDDGGHFIIPIPEPKVV